ncbi:hypothetical protein NG796_14355 [Laspinema sp. A4]|uniref:hypothetical protein n=1 Tax=Laspinema sp. D2d TaxID=2953686 RepID=UPI0021BABACF|nr:hypothetical protein [Laspinema sp. D2d]MCT7984480.1 hypothetical protein [Laspinema sp. D2d]
MEIYVKSRGFSQEEGYCWLPETPSILTLNRVIDCIQSESPSLLLGRYSGRLLLLITGLEAKGRTDFRDRTIRNSIAWVAEDSAIHEQQLRAIAVRALRTFVEEKPDGLEGEIDQAIPVGGPDGFSVNWELLKGLSASATLPSHPPKSDREREEQSTDKLAKNCDRTKETLATQLEHYGLPQREGPLVVVTGIKSKDALIQAGVWRGLSKSVEEEDWTPIRERQDPLSSQKEPFQAEKKFNETATLVAGIVAIGMLFLGLLWF